MQPDRIPRLQGRGQNPPLSSRLVSHPTGGPYRQTECQGQCAHELRDSVADWSMIPGPKAPEGAPNVLVVLIDDAGFGAIDTFGGPVTIGQ